MKVMLADDERSIIKVVKHVVEDMGYDFVFAMNGKDAVDLFFRENPDIVILDVMMPKLDGFDVCNIIRQKSETPVLFLTARSDIVDKSVGFKLGADDYLVKPFYPTELELRINSLLKRRVIQNNLVDVDEDFHYKNLTIHYNNFEVILSGEKLIMTMKEFSILTLLSKNPGQVFTRNQIISNVWGNDYVGDENILTVYIRKIREKIEEDPSQPEYLLTVWGVGYKFANDN